MQAYVINLARSPDRRAYITAELAKTNQRFEIVEAVDGRDLDLEDNRLVDPSVVRDGAFRLGAGGPGAAGCALSHHRVYRKILEDGHDKALVLEDDISFPSDLAELVDALGVHMEGAEVVLLNFHSAKPCRVAKAGSVPLPASRQIVRPVDLGQPHSTGAYVITREACQRMAETVLPVRVTADDWEFFCKQGAIDRLRCVVPMPVVNTANFRSTIDFYHPGSLQARLRELAANGRVPILKQILAYRRRRTFRRLGWVGRVEFVEEAFD